MTRPDPNERAAHLTSDEPVEVDVDERGAGRPVSVSAASDTHSRTSTRLPTSRVATAALALAWATAIVAVAAMLGGLSGTISELVAVGVLQVCLGGTFLTATVAAIGWMHARRRVDGRVDPAGIRRSKIAGLVAAAVLIAVTLGLGELATHHDVEVGDLPARISS
jgi:hypothetical protein